MKTTRIVGQSLFVIACAFAVITVRGQDMLYFHDNTSILKPLHTLPDLQYPAGAIDPQCHLYTTLKQDLLKAQTEEQMNEVINEIILYSICYDKPGVFQALLDEVNDTIAYFEPRVGHRFDYGALKKGLGLGILTGLAVYGIKHIQRAYYTPEETLKAQALKDLNIMGVEHHSRIERNLSYDIYTTDFSGIISRDTLPLVQSKIIAFQSHQAHADTARGGQCMVGGAGFIAGIVGVGYIYRGLTTDCAHEYVRFSLIKVKLEETQAALDSALSKVY